MPHLLLVEDNRDIWQNITSYLEAEGYTLDRFRDGTEGLEALSTHTYDLIMLDVMLPGADGFSVLKELRKTKKTPVIMTTARGELDDKAEGFGDGADDYLVKPFALPELVMRIESLLKRSQPADIFRRGEIEVHIEDNLVTKAGEEVKLTTKEFLILSYLIEADGHTVTRANLIDYIRGGDSLFESDGKLDVYISNLRKKLDKKLIETIKGVGYRLGK